MNVFLRRAPRCKSSLSGLYERPSRAAPLAIKRNARVQDCHRKHRQENHGPFQDHESHFVIGNGSVETLLQLRNTVYRTDEDEQNSRAEGILEPSELLPSPQLDEADVFGTLTRPAEAEYEFQPQSHEDEQRDDLKRKTSDHDGPSCLAPGVIIGCGCKPTAGALKDKRDKVACHEGDCVGARAEAGDVLTVDDDYAGEAEVEGAGEEGGANCQGDEVAMRVFRTLFSDFDRPEG